MQIGFFGSIGDRLGRDIVHRPPPQTATVADLRRSLAAAFPQEEAVLTGSRLKAVIGDSVVGDDASVAGIDRVEFFPPVSGG